MSKLPDFEGLAMFAKVAEERSFAGAAYSMGVSEPPCRGPLHALRSDLGDVYSIERRGDSH